MDIRSPLVAHQEPTVPCEPCQRTLHYPPVPPQSLANIFPSPCDAALDAASSERLTASGKVVALSACRFSGGLRGRPLPGRLIGPTASTSSSKTLESCTLAAVNTTARGTPLRSVRRWCLEPGLPRSVGLEPTASPPFGGHARRVQARPRPVHLAALSQQVQKCSMQTSPYARLLPVPKPSPAGHAATETHLLGQHSQRDATTEHEDDAREHGPVRYPRPTAPRPGRLGWVARSWRQA